MGETMQWYIARLEHTKNGDARNDPLTEARRENTYTFPSPAGPQRISNISAAFPRIAKRANVQGARFHDFRHTFCTRHVEGGLDLITLADITGHKTLTMLRVFSHP